MLVLSMNILHPDPKSKKYRKPKTTKFSVLVPGKSEIASDGKETAGDKIVPP